MAQTAERQFTALLPQVAVGLLAKAARAKSNSILSHLSAIDLSLLEPHLKFVDLPTRFQIETCNKAIKHAYFIDSGVVSVVSVGGVWPLSAVAVFVVSPLFTSACVSV